MSHLQNTRLRAWLMRFGALQRLLVALVVALAAFLWQPDAVLPETRVLVSWDLGALVYLALAWTLMARADPRATREHALAQDQSSYLIFLFVVGAACAGIVAIGFMVSNLKGLAFWPRTWHLGLSVGALISAWLLIQTVFAFHYARRYYAARHHDPAAAGGLLFPGGHEPDYLDFAYYAFVVGMTSQVSDVAVSTRALRRLTLIHGALAFIFNIAILALSINIIASVI